MKTNNSSAMVRLEYAPGDLIIKEGDFGISIYAIISGKVEIFVNSDKQEIKVATQGPGDLIGGMSFISGNTAPRTASVRAIENCVIEAWHPVIIRNAYQKMPAIFKLIAGQAIKRLVRMNTIVLKFKKKEATNGTAYKTSVKHKENRKYYRKKVNLKCFYQPLDNPKRITLEGRVIDISRGGLHIEVSALNAVILSYMPGDEFMLNIYLADNQELKMTAAISNLDQGVNEDSIRLGMSFINMINEDKKHLGFFLIQ
ncbi:cyclic nucleotide-binding domain-containing protein [Desulfococcaceae bacterium HSG9]|nr:cyclic nucleotide-binding domain-containing protein [Desulfococcaceae bacterium HSG9]